MQKEVEKKAVKMAHRSGKDHYLLSAVATLFSFLLIVLGIVTLILIQKPIRESQELRQQASTDVGQVTVQANAPSTIIKGQPATVTFSVNTHGVQTDGVQLIFDLVGLGVENVNVGLVDNSGLRAEFQEVTATSQGYHISLLTVPSGGLQSSFTTTSNKEFFRLTFTPTLEETISIRFDTDDSISTVHGSDPPRDELKTIPNIQISVVAPAVSPSPSASPSVSPAASPSTSPSASPSVSPASSPATSPSVSPAASPVASPSVSPSPDAGTGGTQLKGCNEECSNSDECPNNYGCYDISGTGRCRLANNVSSTTCQNPPERGISRACNEYCADNRECKAGFTCFYNRCRLPVNPDSATCSQPTQQIAQTVAQGCNKACSSNRDCATNLRCYSGSCRLATNPGSLTCTAATVSSGSISSQKGQNLTPGTSPSPTGSPKASTSPSASPVGTKPSTSPFVQPSIAPSTTPLVEVDTEPLVTTEPEDQTALDAVVENLRQRGITFPLAMIVSGLVILGLVLLLILIRSMSHRSGPTQTVYKPSGQDQQYLHQLQNKIKTFEQTPTTPTVPPMGPVTPPPPVQPPPQSPSPMPTFTPPPPPVRPAAPPPVLSQPQPIRPVAPVTQVVRPVVPPPLPAQPPAPITPSVPQGNRPAAPPPPIPTTGSTMLERLKQKGITPPGSNS